MTDLSSRFPLLVDDEFELLAQLVPLAGASVLDVGCGAGAFTARMVDEGRAARVTGLEVDQAQLEKNRRRSSWPVGVIFVQSGAQALPFGRAEFDSATFFKSLHHVPVDAMDAAFAEVRRVLRPGGLMYVSEPVYDGPFNDLMKLFHDEGVVRTAALAATTRAVAGGLFTLKRRIDLFTSVTFRDFDDFHRRMMMPTHSHIALDSDLVTSVRRAYDRHQTSTGARFIRPVRVDVLVRR